MRLIRSFRFEISNINTQLHWSLPHKNISLIMADNRYVPSILSRNSNNAFLENQPIRFATLLGSSPVTVGTNIGYMVSNPTTITTTTNNTNAMLMMPPPPPTLTLTQPLCGRSVDLPQDPREDHTGSSSKKTRGRPKGAKNKPKPVSTVTNENTDILMEPFLIDIPSGKDVMETLINLARCQQAGITVLSGFGLISEATLLEPMPCARSFCIKGLFQMTSLSGTYINANGVNVPPRFMRTNPTYSSFSIILSGANGQVFGGIVGGNVKAAGVVSITATLFKKPSFHRMGVINGSVREITEDDPIYDNGFIMNFDQGSCQPITRTS